MDAIGDASSVAVTGLIELAHQARHARDAVELEFIVVNSTHALAPYRQAALWRADGGVTRLSGVVQTEANAPYVQWLDRLCAGQASRGMPDAPTALSATDMDEETAREWAEWLPAYGLWLPAAQTGGDGDRDGDAPRIGLFLARDLPWMDHEIALLAEWMDIWAHAWQARLPRRRWTLSALLTRSRARLAQERRAGLPWWRRRAVQGVAVLGAALLCPIHLSVLAPGELVPGKPAVVRAPLEGVIERFHVAPNQTVRKGEPLFDFDEAQLASRYAVSSQALVTAEAEYRQSAQQALTDSKSKGQLATLQGKIEERRTEAEFLRGQAERARVLAPQDGIVLLDDPGEWIGRPVATGERILRVATPNDVEVEAWLAVGDAIPLKAGDKVKLYLSASPLAPVAAQIRYVSYDAMQRPDGAYAYRVRARLDGPTDHRVGLKGTARLTGPWVPLAYWMLRRPFAFVRQTVGW